MLPRRNGIPFLAHATSNTAPVINSYSEHHVCPRRNGIPFLAHTTSNTAPVINSYSEHHITCVLAGMESHIWRTLQVTPPPWLISYSEHHVLPRRNGISYLAHAMRTTAP